MQVPAGLASPEASAPGLSAAPSSLCSHVVSSLGAHVPGITSSSCEVRPHSMTSFNLHILLKGPVSSHTGGQGFNVWILRGHSSVSNSVVSFSRREEHAGEGKWNISQRMNIIHQIVTQLLRLGSPARSPCSGVPSEGPGAP